MHTIIILKTLLIAEKRLFYFSVIYLVGIAIVMLIQNYIRYGGYSTYQPWGAILFLLIGLIFIIPLLPFYYFLIARIQKLWASKYWIATGMAILLTIGLFFIAASGVMYLIGKTDFFFSEMFTRYYFGRIILFHIALLVAFNLYYQKKGVFGVKHIQASLGRRKVTVSLDQVSWIEADDHYLRLYTNKGMLLKRATLDKLTDELSPYIIRIHRKYAVNRQYVSGKEKQNRDEFLRLTSGERLKVSRSYLPIDFI